ALIVRIDVVDVHADVLALDAATHRADRAVGALRADADHAAAELDQRVADHALRTHQPCGRDLAEPERAFQELERGADVLIRKLGNDRRSAPGLDLLPDRRHEHLLSPVERGRLERGLAPPLPHQVPEPRRAGASLIDLSRSRTATAARSRAPRRTSCAARTRSGTARRAALPRLRRPPGGPESGARWRRGGRR